MSIRKHKYWLLLCFLCLFQQNVKAISDLDLLRDKGLITQEEYNILKDDVEYEEEGEVFYNLMVNGELRSKIYEVIAQNKTYYFPVKSFFNVINFKNYTEENSVLKANLGDSLKEVRIDLENNSIMVDKTYIELKEGELFKKNDEIYIEKNVFKNIFLNHLTINQDMQKLNMTLSFASPEEINLRMKRTEKLVKEEAKINEIIYTNNNKLFELGYLRTDIAEVFTKKVDDDKKGFEKDWEANVEYQGSLLYGEFTTNYDFKEHTFREAKLRYDEIYNQHTLEIGNYAVGEGSGREWELSFRKDKGYLITGSKDYIIKEDVPIGSRVELIYMGTVIDIQNANTGEVEFRRSEIKEDREYTLKIYTPDGKIYTKTINTTSDYNQQNKGEIEYDFSLRERHDINKSEFNSNIYYGLTDTITLGAGYNRSPELINNEYIYLNKGRAEAIYSDSIFSMPFTLKAGGEKVFNDETYNTNLKRTKDDYSYDFLGQIDIKKLRFKAEQKHNGEFYENKRERNFSIRYTPIQSLDLEYEWERIDKYKNDIEYNQKLVEKDSSFNVEYSKSIKDWLFTGEYENSRTNEDEYGLNLYYTGWRTLTARLENRWTNGGKDYEMALSLFNNGNEKIDYSFEARYSEENKESLTFRFSMNLDNLLEFDSMFDKEGNQEYKIGIDRITDLRNPKAKITSMDSSRLKVITFVDLNNNNLLDEGEQRIDNVEVKVGNQKVKTDKNGEGVLYGIPNEVLYDLNPEIKKPNFLLGNNKIKIKGKNTSTIEAHIPVKPMVTLTGIVNIDKQIRASKLDKMRIYENIFIQIKDLNGNVLDSAMPDETGVFEVSGLYPKKYFIEVQYIGIDYNIKGVNEVIQLSYIDEDKDGNKIYFVFSEDEIAMFQKGGPLKNV